MTLFYSRDYRAIPRILRENKPAIWKLQFLWWMARFNGLTILSRFLTGVSLRLSACVNEQFWHPGCFMKRLSSDEYQGDINEPV